MMNSLFLKHIAIIHMTILLFVVAQAITKQTQERTTLIRSIVEKNIRETGTDLEKIHQEVSRHMPLDPAQTPEYFEWMNKKEKAVKQKYPMTDQQLRAIMYDEVKNIYPLYKIGDSVSVTYFLHGKSFKVSGIYYRNTGNFLYVGSAKIAKHNIPSEIASRFDAKKNAALQEKYIIENIQSYHNKRNAYSARIFKDEIMQSQGYLKIAQKWISARDYVQMELKRAAENNAKTQIKLGDRYAMQKKYVEAVKCYREAAELGNSDAQLYLGDYYRIGQGVKKDRKLEIYWYRKSAEQGNKIAQFILGDYYRIGYGVKKNTKQVLYWWRKSAEQGFAKAQNYLGECYATGYGVEQDFRQAVYWRRKSAEQGNKDAQFNLGVCYERGDGVEQDFRQTVYWWRKSAEQGLAEAQYNLGEFYRLGYGVKQDSKRMTYWFRKSAEQGYAKAQYGLGMAYVLGSYGMEKDLKQAVYWFRKSAEQGLAEAQYILGQAYVEGSGIEQDFRQAVYWFRKSAEQGHAKAQYKMGVAYLGGIGGIEKDFRQAGYWILKSAQQGDEDAKELLKKIGYY